MKMLMREGDMAANEADGVDDDDSDGGNNGTLIVRLTVVYCWRARQLICLVLFLG